MDIQETAEPSATLARLGFSDMEAAIYVDLLKHPGSTGYRVGRSIRKPHANVYQALVALEQKGAVWFEEGETRIYSAVKPNELIGNLKNRYQRECEQAERALATLEVKAPEEDRFFRLTSRDQVLARAAAMLAEAKETVLIELFPAWVEPLRPNIEEAIARGVIVAGLVFREEDMIEGGRFQVSGISDRVSQVWPVDQMVLVIDACEFLIAHLDKRGVLTRATWVTSPFVATILNNGIVADVILHGLPEAKQIFSFNRHVFGILPPGLRQLLGISES
ncbi:MAG TPA: helix-turn-helix domain-containing protein [Allosphingosinicella sp.]|jgi:sugar-specific transcriptional regulator TrmB